MGGRQRRRGGGCLGTLLTLALAGLVVVLAVIVVGLIRKHPATGTLTGLQGSVETRAETGVAWTLAANDQQVGAGERVRTGGASAASLLFFDASSVSLGENTEIGILDAYTIRGGAGGHLSMKHWAGQASLRMVRFPSPRSEFVVETPNATTLLSSGGAQIQTNVTPGGPTTVTVDVGTARVTSNGPLTAAVPGKVIARRAIAKPATPAYQAGQSVVLTAGQTATIDANGIITVSQSGGPPPGSLPDAIAQALGAPGTTFSLTFTEQMVNAYVNTTDTGIEEYGISSPTVWFAGGNVVFGGQLSATDAGLPVGGPFTIVATPYVTASQSIGLNVISANIGGVALPAGVVTQSINLAEDAIDEALSDPTYPLQVTGVQVNEGSITITGTKPAP